MRLCHPVAASASLCLLISTSSFAANSGCDYWERLSIEEIDGRMEAARARQLTMQAGQALIAYGVLGPLDSGLTAELDRSEAGPAGPIQAS